LTHGKEVGMLQRAIIIACPESRVWRGRGVEHAWNSVAGLPRRSDGGIAAYRM